MDNSLINDIKFSSSITNNYQDESLNDVEKVKEEEYEICFFDQTDGKYKDH
jgi:hypothetical protein